MNQPIEPATEYPVHCCVCLNMTGEKTAAKWLSPAGYLMCEVHVDSSIEELKQMVWKRGKPA
jgi:hypothetical protein